MSNIDDVDFFRSGVVLKDPYPYYEQLRARCPVQALHLELDPVG